MSGRWRPMRVLSPVRPAQLAGWRERLADAREAEVVARLAEEHAGLLMALLRRAGSLGLPGSTRPLDAVEACRLLGVEAGRRLLHGLLLLSPEGEATPLLELRIMALREVAAALLERLGEAGPAGALPERSLRTLLRLLELVPRALDPAGAPEQASAWGEELLALSGGERWLHPRLSGGLRALAGQAATAEDARTGALLRAAIDLSGAPRRDAALAARLDLLPDLPNPRTDRHA